MTEEQLKTLYNAEIESSAPDKDALWAKIESRLTPKAAPEEAKTQTTISTTESPRKKPLHLTILKYAAACAVLLIAVPVALNVINVSSDMTSDAPMADAEISADHIDEMNNAANDEASQDYSDSAADEAPTENESIIMHAKPLRYSDLQFTSYSETYYTCTGTPYGDSYFVEEDILADTDEIIIAEVSKVSLSEDGSSIVYELVNVQGHTDESIIVESRSPYTMRRGRQYLLPLAKTEVGWRTVYDNVPQIEFTASGGFVYYNGWESLDADDSESLIYPQESVDEFFYDRMMFKSSGDISGLINKWKAAKQA